MNEMHSAKLQNGEMLGIRNIYCVGRNYQDHAKELNNPVPKEPLIFLKTTGSIRGFEVAEMAFAGESFHHELELILLVGQNVKLGQKCGWDVIKGLGLGLDLTRREKQSKLKEKGHPWTLSKSFAGSAVVGEFIEPSSLGSLTELSYQLKVNDELKQTGHIREMIFDVPTVLSYLSSFTPLFCGDLIYTGTPKGVGPITKGDTFEAKILDSDYRQSGTL